MTADAFTQFLLHATGTDYALCNRQLRIETHSPGLKRWVWSSISDRLEGQALPDLFPEFIGLDDALRNLHAGQEPVRIERIFRQVAEQQAAYLTLEVYVYQDKLLLLARDVTAEGNLEQRITQTRNELHLLSEQLQQSSARLDTIVRRFVPSAIVDEMLRDERKALPGGERREISVVFADVRNFTHWAEARSPETVLRTLNYLWATVISVAAEYGGTVNQFMGDGAMLMFNAPEPQPDHAFQALQCARELARINAGESGLRFGVGVNSGPVVVGNLGNRERLSYTAIGTTTNMAYRLQSIARPGQVILGEATHQRVAGRVPCHPLEAVQLKGLSAPLQIFELLP